MDAKKKPINHSGIEDSIRHILKIDVIFVRCILLLRRITYIQRFNGDHHIALVCIDVRIARWLNGNGNAIACLIRWYAILIAI